MTLPPPLLPENFRYRIFLGHRRVPDTIFFGIVRQQTFDRKSWYFPHCHKIFRNPNCSETQKGSSMKELGTVRQNDFDGVSWFPTPLLSNKFFVTRNILKHRRVHLRSFLVLWVKIFSTQKPDFPFISIKFFVTPIIMKHRKVPLWNNLVQWDKTISTEKKDCRPLFYPYCFWIAEINETLKFSPTKFFGQVKQKCFDRLSWYSLPRQTLAISIKFFYTGIFSKTHQRRVPLISFSVLWGNKFWIKNRDIPLIGINFFRYPKLSETQKGSSTKQFDTARQKIFNGKAWLFHLKQQFFWFHRLVTH